MFVMGYVAMFWFGVPGARPVVVGLREALIDALHLPGLLGIAAAAVLTVVVKQGHAEHAALAYTAAIARERLGTRELQGIERLAALGVAEQAAKLGVHSAR